MSGKSPDGGATSLKLKSKRDKRKHDRPDISSPMYIPAHQVLYCWTYTNAAFKSRLCYVPGKSRQTAWAQGIDYVYYLLLFIWLQHYIVLKSISHVYHWHKNTASVGAAIVVSRAMWRQRANWEYINLEWVHGWEIMGFDCRSSALSRVEGWKNTGNGLAWNAA